MNTHLLDCSRVERLCNLLRHPHGWHAQQLVIDVALSVVGPTPRAKIGSHLFAIHPPSLERMVNSCRQLLLTIPLLGAKGGCTPCVVDLCVRLGECSHWTIVGDLDIP
jgi:hypothetical protein